LPDRSSCIGESVRARSCVRIRDLWRRAALVSGVALAVAGLALPAHAYRTAADLPDFDGTPKVRWPSDTVEYVLNAEVPGGMSIDSVASTVQQALSAWTEPNCSVLKFRSAGTTSAKARPGDGLNTIQWVSRQWSEDGFPPDAAALTDLQYEQQSDGAWSIVEADLYLNAERYQWVEAPAASDHQNLLSVVTHEAGHILGLLHPCEPGGADGAPACDSNPGFAETTMYPFYSAEQATLADDDIAGACFLYSGSRCEVDGCRPGRTCTPEGCRVECAGTICGELEVCVNAACRSAEPPCDDSDCNEPKACETDADCPSPLHCVEQLCTVGPGAPGDACSSERDCAAGFCSASGACLGSCSSDDDCAAGISCDFAGSLPTCGGKDARPLGSACERANDCASGYCVADLSDAPLCSRSCGGANAACPGGFTCGQVAGNALCVPEQPEASGCACAVPATGKPDTSLPLIALGLAFAFRRRAGRRTSDRFRQVHRNLERS
jgi:hypothetical protein